MRSQCISIYLIIFQSKQGTDVFVITMLVIQICCSFGIVFFMCEMGHRISSQFDDICDVIHQFKWYSFPIELKRILSLIILDAQQPVAINCFGSIMCDRDSFKKVSIDQQTKLIVFAIDIDSNFIFTDSKDCMVLFQCYSSIWILNSTRFIFSMFIWYFNHTYIDVSNSKIVKKKKILSLCQTVWYDCHHYNDISSQ